MYGVFLWLVQSSSCWNTLHSLATTMFICWVFGSANSVTRPDRDNQYNMRIVYSKAFERPFGIEWISSRTTVEMWTGGLGRGTYIYHQSAEYPPDLDNKLREFQHKAFTASDFLTVLTDDINSTIEQYQTQRHMHKYSLFWIRDLKQIMDSMINGTPKCITHPPTRMSTCSIRESWGMANTFV